MHSLLIMTLALAAFAGVSADKSLFVSTSDEEILKNAEPIIKCLISEAPCSELATNLKELVLQSVPKQCSDCSAESKHKMGMVFNYISTNYPAEFEKYLNLIDPKKEKRDFLKKFLAENQ